MSGQRRERRSQDDRIHAEGYSPVTTSLASVAVERVDWLWPYRIPRGKITVLDGDPALGKSTIAMDLAARVTRGWPLPGDEGEFAPAGVILMSAEDGMGDTIRPRLEEAGGDPRMVHLFEGISNEPGVLVPATIPTHVPELGDLIERHRAALVIIDPLTAYLEGRHDAYRDQDVRGALKPLARVAEQTGASILIIRHLSKSGGPNALYRGGGSIGIIGAARSGLLVARDPEQPSRSIVAVTKSNLAAKAPALAYRLVEATRIPSHGFDGKVQPTTRPTIYSAGAAMVLPSTRLRRSSVTCLPTARCPLRRSRRPQSPPPSHGPRCMCQGPDGRRLAPERVRGTAVVVGDAGPRQPGSTRGRRHRTTVELMGEPPADDEDWWSE